MNLIIRIALIAAVALLFNYPLMWLMNYVFTPTVLTVLFGVAKMTFWRTYAFGMLTGLIFRRSQ
jgi:hypothetical protein